MTLHHPEFISKELPFISKELPSISKELPPISKELPSEAWSTERYDGDRTLSFDDAYGRFSEVYTHEETCELKELADVLVQLGGALLAYGSPVHRIEEVLFLIAEEYHHKCEVFAVPTGLWLSVTSLANRRKEPILRLIRVYEWQVDLERLRQLDDLFNQILERETSLTTALEEIQELNEKPRVYPIWRELIVTSAICSSSAFFFGGRTGEVVVGALLGVLGVLLMRWVRGRNQTRLLIDFLVGLQTGLVVWGASLVNPDLLRKPMILAGIIIIVPGMTLTVGLGEMVHRQLVSGGARLLHAAMVFVSMVLGLAVAIRIESWWVGGPVSLGLTDSGATHPLWLTAMVAFATGIAFADLFLVPARYVLLAAGSCLIAWLSTAFATQILSAGPLAAFGGALGLGLYANAFTRLTGRPGQLFLLPGLFLLVPGSIGFLGFERFLNGDATQGTLFVFTAVMNAGGLITGLLMASAALSPRKLL